MKKTLFILTGLALLVGLLLVGPGILAQAQEPAEDSNLTALGKALFFDEELSVNGTQSCATCHGPGRANEAHKN